tara:strand:+ start:33329 stop:34273 length:945 start_codon:yes stop_codon:yes gene_type:complete
MATLGDYYYDGNSFALATGLFDDAAMTIVASDGWYGHGGIYRQMAGGILGSPQPCISCITACGTSVSGDVFAQSKVTVDVGNTTGAVLVEFTVGLTSTARCTWTYNGVSASEYSSPLVPGGYLQGLIGDENCCGVSNAAGSGGNTYTGSVQEYSGGAWVPTGGVTTWGPYTDQASGGVDLDPNGVGWGTTIMVVPKTSAVLNTIDFVIDTPDQSIPSTWDWTLKVICPAALDAVDGGTVNYVDCPAACLNTTVGMSWYHAVVSGTPGQPAVNDWLFADADGATPAPDGYFSLFFSGAWHCVQTENGVIINITAC